MTLDNKIDIQNEYATKIGVIRAITPSQVNTSLAGLDNFVNQCNEAILVLQAREVLNSRPISTSVISALTAASAALSASSAAIRTRASEIQSILPD